jgi:cytosine/creatinine deaminase
VKDGHIVEISDRLKGQAVLDIDAGGNLVTESYVNPHLHLCKVFTLPMMEEEALKAYQGAGGTMGTAMAGIELASKIKEKYAEDWIAENARRAIARSPRLTATCIFAPLSTSAARPGWRPSRR